MGLEVCALCQSRRQLQDSHLLPKALYRLARDPNPPFGVGPDPLHVTPERTIQTSAQITCRLLCDACEQRFSRFGEAVVIKECWRRPNEFVLRDKLESEKPFSTKGDSSSFSGSQLVTVDVEKYRYFVSSVVWRASVGRWPQDLNMKWRHSLGARYEEAFRKYLLGVAAFPASARILVFVAQDPDPARFSAFPVSESFGGYRAHTFHIPGSEFRLLVGSRIDGQAGEVFRRMSTNIAFDLRTRVNSVRFRRIGEMMRRSPLKGKLRRST